MICNHESCSREKRIWLPIDHYSNGTDASLHHWCIHCGLVKNISDDRAKRMGYWMNILSKISYHFSFTQCQKRLIANELRSYDQFEDGYGTTGSAQKELFGKIVKKYCNININTIYSFVC